MKFNTQAILSNKHFFNILQTNNNKITYKLENSSQILLKNIYTNWLRYLFVKTQKSMPIFVEQSKQDLSFTKKDTDVKPPFGFIRNIELDYKNTVLEHDLNEYGPVNKTEVGVNLIVPKVDINQYFIQWQRYRKYWWSSITTTPSLFSVDDVKQTGTESNVDIIANLPSGKQTVEHINVRGDEHYQQCSSLMCKLNLEDALITLLLDGSTNTECEYLRLHRQLAPYKISFALNCTGDKVETLKNLAKLLNHRLKIEKISAWLPTFTMTIEDQIRENLHMGATYTAILSDSTLDDGIFHLMSSSTSIKEQVHIADFHTYAALICSNK